MTFLLPSGVAFHEAMYPQHGWHRPRQRGLAFLRHQTGERASRILGEGGDILGYFPWTRDGWEDVARLVTRDKLTVYTTFGDGSHRFPWLSSATHDRESRVLVTRKRGPVGVSVSRGKRHGGFSCLSGYHVGEIGLPDDSPDAFPLIKKAGEVLGVGIYDSAAALGTAALYRYWTLRGIPHVQQLPEGLADLFLRYRIGGRVQTAIGHYPRLYEYDLRRAHPTVVRGGLPFSWHHFAATEPKPGQPYYGLWHVRVHDDIEHSPIPQKDWSQDDAQALWRLPIGHYDYAGWGEEIAALRQTGRASADFRYGWVWPSVSHELSPWIDEMNTQRLLSEELGEDDLAFVIKTATNAAIGRWGIDPRRMELIPLEESPTGSWLMSLPRWTCLDSDVPDFAVSESQVAVPTPLHWCSYVRMKVRMAIYEMGEDARAQGATVVMENFDALTTEQPVTFSQEVFQVKLKEWSEADIITARWIAGYVRDESGEERFTANTPGVPKQLALTFGGME